MDQESAYGDSSLCLIIEQRIPAGVKTREIGNTTTFTTEPDHNEIVKLKDDAGLAGLERTGGSFTSTNFGSVEIDGNIRQFMYGFSIYHFRALNPAFKAELKKSDFENLPDDYRFENIVFP